jgi:hypothetical protein
MELELEHVALRSSIKRVDGLLKGREKGWTVRLREALGDIKVATAAATQQHNT